ncbi:MAG TPA: four helix bundle protein [Anaerolineales bacterium]|nr:four helix bundle protein [Anaerolineales bacterium]
MAYDKELPFEEWVQILPVSLRNDPLWKSAYYRLAMYLYDLVWLDADVIKKDFRGREIVHQIVWSAGSVCANMEEAYRRGIGTADFVRIMRIALGELGETQAWYFRSRHILSQETLDERIKVIQQAIALAVTVIDKNRKR